MGIRSATEFSRGETWESSGIICGYLKFLGPHHRRIRLASSISNWRSRVHRRNRQRTTTGVCFVTTSVIGVQLALIVDGQRAISFDPRCVLDLFFLERDRDRLTIQTSTLDRDETDLGPKHPRLHRQPIRLTGFVIDIDIADRTDLGPCGIDHDPVHPRIHLRTRTTHHNTPFPKRRTGSGTADHFDRHQQRRSQPRCITPNFAKAPAHARRTTHTHLALRSIDDSSAAWSPLNRTSECSLQGLAHVEQMRRRRRRQPTPSE